MSKAIRTTGLLFLSLAGIIFSGSAPADEKPLVGKKVALIIASQQFRDEEFKEPRDLLIGKGASVFVVSSSLKESTGMLGMKVKPDILLEDLSIDVVDAVLFIGGIGASEYFTDYDAWSVAREAVKRGKVLGAICIAPVTLAKAGLLKGKMATVYSSEKETLIKAGARYTGKPVTVDGNIVTANGPQAAREFAEAVIRLVK